MTLKKGDMSQPKDYKMIVEKDVWIPLRDGTRVCADIFRPESNSEKFPVIMSLGPYQKDKLWVPPPDLEEKPNPYMNWETVNPEWWCPRGYAMLRVDTRGSGKSPGKSEPSSYQESLDAYDCIEWVAKQSWCSGKVGTCGISYLAAFQWKVAGLQPPSLKCIIPWEGRADQYRDQAYHGGVFAMGFISNWANRGTAWALLDKSHTYNPDGFDNNLLWNFMRNSLDSEYWRLCSARWDKIEVPVLSAGNWSGFGMHLRGNTEAYLCAKSKHKKLRIHSGTHFHAFYSEEGRIDQLRFMDHWLKGIDTGFMDEPPVKLEIRTGGTQRSPFRFEDDWPIPRTQWTKMYLRIDRQPSANPKDAEGELVTAPLPAVATASYGAAAPSRPGKIPRGVSFETPPMAEDTEVTGHIVLNVWVSSTNEDMDIFATIRNIDPAGNDVMEMGQMGEPLQCVTKGWLRASHRKLDAAKSLPYRPYHAHNERWPLKPGEPVECQVEIIATSMVFKKGHKLRLDISPADGVGTQHFTHFSCDYNQGGTSTIHSGGDKPTWLLLPIIPPK